MMLTSRLRDPGFQRILFRRINVMMLLAWRLGLGWLINAAPGITGRVMVLSRTGRRSGRIRRFPTLRRRRVLPGGVREAHQLVPQRACAPRRQRLRVQGLEGIDARRIDDDTLRELAERFPPMRITIAGPAAGRRAGDLAGAWVPIAAGALAICARRTCRPS